MTIRVFYSNYKLLLLLLVLLDFCLPLYIFADVNQDINFLKHNFYVGFEVSELLQNNFTDFGNKNFTFFLGQKFWFKNLQNFGYRFLLINVDLSSEHLKENNFIKGDKSGLTGNLIASRIYLDWYIARKKLLFTSIYPIFSTGFGFNKNVVTNKEIYDFRGITLNIGFRLQNEFFERIFIEFPVVDTFVYLWKNRNAKGNIDNTLIDYPEWGMIFL